VELASNPRREEVSAGVRCDCGRRCDIPLEPPCEPPERAVALPARQSFRRLEPAIEGGVLERRDIGSPVPEDFAPTEGAEDEFRVIPKRPSDDGQVERFTASSDATEVLADRERPHLDVDSESPQVAPDDLRLRRPRSNVGRIHDRSRANVTGDPL